MIFMLNLFLLEKAIFSKRVISDAAKHFRDGLHYCFCTKYLKISILEEDMYGSVTFLLRTTRNGNERSSFCVVLIRKCNGNS